MDTDIFLDEIITEVNEIKINLIRSNQGVYIKADYYIGNDKYASADGKTIKEAVNNLSAYLGKIWK